MKWDEEEEPEEKSYYDEDENLDFGSLDDE